MVSVLLKMIDLMILSKHFISWDVRATGLKSFNSLANFFFAIGKTVAFFSRAWTPTVDSERSEICGV